MLASKILRATTLCVSSIRIQRKLVDIETFVVEWHREREGERERGERGERQLEVAHECRS
jgi:hypothetical protein